MRGALHRRSDGRRATQSGPGLRPDWLAQVQAMCRLLYPAGLNIDYYPTNSVPCDGMLYYIDCTSAAPIWSRGTSSTGVCRSGRRRRRKGRKTHESSMGGQAPLCGAGAARAGGVLRHLFCQDARAEAARHPDPADRTQKGNRHPHRRGTDEHGHAGHAHCAAALHRFRLEPPSRERAVPRLLHRDARATPSFCCRSFA